LVHMSLSRSRAMFVPASVATPTPVRQSQFQNFTVIYIRGKLLLMQLSGTSQIINVVARF